MRLLGSNMITVADLPARSPVPIPSEPEKQFELVMRMLYEPHEVVELKAARPRENEPKPGPSGAGVRRTANDWADLATTGRHVDILGNHSGAFMFINSVEGSRGGSGTNGCTADKDIATFNYCLIEHDLFDIDFQASLLGTLALPIAAIVDSGGKSLHAWVKIGATWAGDFAEEVKSLYAYLGSYLGYDPLNKNPARLTRAPGFDREDTPGRIRRQALVYLNPNPDATPIIS